MNAIARMLQVLMALALVAAAGTIAAEALAKVPQQAPLPRPARVRYISAPNPFVQDPIAITASASPSPSPSGGILGGLGASGGLQILGVMIVNGVPTLMLSNADGQAVNLRVGDHFDAQRTIRSITMDAVTLSDGSVIPVFSANTPGANGNAPNAPYMVPAIAPMSAPYAAPAAPVQPYVPSPAPNTPQQPSVPSPYGGEMAPSSTPQPPYGSPRPGRS